MMQLFECAMARILERRQGCLLWTFLLLLMSSPFSSVVSVQLNNPHGPLKDKCPVCKDIVKAFHEGLKSTAKSNYGGGNTNWEESRLGSYAFSEVRLTEIMEGLCSGVAPECHHLLEEHEELVEHFWNKEYAKQTGTDFFQWLCIDNIKVCCPNNTYGPSCQPCKGGLVRPCKDNGFCKGEGTREGTGECICHHGYDGDRCDECTDGFYEGSNNETHTECIECDRSCKHTCQEGGPTGCDECKDGYTHSQQDGCQDIDECEDKPDLCGTNYFCSNSPGSFTCLQCDKECQGCTGYGTDKCRECREGYHLVEDRCQDIDECAADTPVCTRDHELCTNRDGGYTCICDLGYEREGDDCILRPKEGETDDDGADEGANQPPAPDSKQEL